MIEERIFGHVSEALIEKLEMLLDRHVRKLRDGDMTAFSVSVTFTGKLDKEGDAVYEVTLKGAGGEKLSWMPRLQPRLEFEEDQER